MAVETVVKLIGAGQVYTTLATWESGAPANLVTAERSSSNTHTGTFTQGETLSFSISGATGKMLDTDNSTYITYGITTGNPGAADVITGGTSGATCVVISGTPDKVGVIWQGQINAASDSFSTTVSLLTISGSTSNTTCYKELTTKAGASFRDNASVQTNALRCNSANGTILTCTSTHSSVIGGSEQYARLSNLQILASGAHHCAAIGTDVSNGMLSPTISNCIMEASPNGSAWPNMVMADAAMITNCLIIGRLSSISTVVSCTGTSSIINTTIVVPSDKTAASNGITNVFGAGNTTVKNVAIFGCTNALTGPGTYNSTTCDCDDASPPSGFTTRTYDTNYFQNITDSTRDYRIKSGSAAVDAGTTDATNAPIDIAGTARPSGSAYDIGCWELVAAAGGGGVPKTNRLLLMGVG